MPHEPATSLTRIALDELHPEVAQLVRATAPDAAWLITERVSGTRQGTPLGGERVTTFEHDGTPCRMAIAVFVGERELYLRSIMHAPAFVCWWFVVRGFAPAAPTNTP